MYCLMTLKILLCHFQSMLFGDDKYRTKKLNVNGHVTTCIVLGTWKNILQSSEKNYILILFLNSPCYATLISWANSQPSPVWGLRWCCFCCCCCIVVWGVVVVVVWGVVVFVVAVALLLLLLLLMMMMMTTTTTTMVITMVYIVASYSN